MAKSKGSRGKDYYARQLQVTEKNKKKKGKTNKKKNHPNYKANVK